MSEFHSAYDSVIFSVHIYPFIIFFIHSSADGYLGCIHISCIENNAAVDIGVNASFKLVFLFSLYLYPAVELLDHMVILSLVFEEPP